MDSENQYKTMAYTSTAVLSLLPHDPVPDFISVTGQLVQDGKPDSK
jgi:uncharacterized membrane protein YkvA (DUF1232 family)